MPLVTLGRYQITGTLGQGAMGTVYSAHDPLIERTVAIKTLTCAGLSQDEVEAFENNFYREAKSAGRLNHPNIVTIHDVGRTEDLAYIAMEHLTGRTLRDILDSGVVLPPARIAKIAAQIADGLAFAHANDVVHRDIKPANIMVLENDIVKIADFGIALLPSGSHTVAGTAYGSPKYMSPEQVVGDKVDGRSDIFSLGAVLYEILTGHPPFAGDDLNAILYQVLNTAPPLPTHFNPGLPPGFDRIVARAMAKKAGKRYQNASEMSVDLRNYRRISGLSKKAPRTDGNVKITPLKPNWPARLLRYGTPILGMALLGAWLLSSETSPTETAPAPSRVATVKESSVAPLKPAPTAPPAPPNAEQATTPAPAPMTVQTPETPLLATEGRIRLAIAPWGEVYVDGTKKGVAPPLTEIFLPAGKHTIEIRNTTFARYRQSIDLAPNTNLRIKHKFE